MNEIYQLKREARNFHLSQVRRLDRELEPKGPKLSLSRALQAASQGRFRLGAPEEWEAWHKPDGDPQRLQLRWEDLIIFPDSQTRDLTYTSSIGGGYTVGVETTPLAMPLIGTGVIQAGARIITNLVGDQVSPVVDTLPDFSWLPTESTAISDDASLSLGQRASTAKNGGSLIKVTHQLSKQSSNIEEDITRLINLLSIKVIDTASLSGSGANGECTGLLNVPGVNSVSGTSLDWNAITDIEEACLLNNANDQKLTYITTPGVKKTIAQAGNGDRFRHDMGR